MKTNALKIGAVAYILWGILHIFGAALLLLQASTEGAASVLTTIGSGVAAANGLNPTSELTTAVLAYYVWNLLWVGVIVVIVGALLNRKNSRVGYWLNLGVVSAVDVGLLIFLVIPGYRALGDGLLGVLFWLPAVLFRTIGQITHQPKPSRQAASA